MHTYAFIAFIYFMLRSQAGLCDVDCEMGTKFLQEPCSNYSAVFQQSSKEVAVIDADKWCSEWCKENHTVQWTNIDYLSGLVNFSLVPAPSFCNHTKYEIKLIPINEHKLFNPHVCELNSSEDCKMIEDFRNWVTNYYPDTYTTCFPQLIGNNSKLPTWKQVTYTRRHWKQDSNSPGLFFCAVNAFYIAEQGVSTSGGGIALAQSNEVLEVHVSFSDIYVPEKFTVFLKSYIEPEDVHDNRFRPVACCEVGRDGDCNQYLQHCNCKRIEDSILCTFQNITPGNYYFDMVDKDDRCHLFLTCEWTDQFVLKPKRVLTKTNPIVQVSFYDYKIIVIVATILFLLLLVIVGILFYKRKHAERVKTFLPLILPNTVSEEGKLKVLLAYPRDCSLFMKTMTEFRKVLKEIIGAEVYDTWDSEIWELVAEKHDTWAVNYCYDRNVKVILMATYCSRFIQDALISGKDVEYTDPQPFDKAFLIIIKCLMQMVTEQTYNRIFVVRLDGANCEQDTFKYINPFTVYTIPQQLHLLECALQNLNHLETNNPYAVDSLSSVINKFNQYQIDNPYYFKHMIKVREKED